MASSTVGKPPNGTVNKTRSIKRSNSLLVQGRPPVVAKERASSLKREQSLKAPNDLTAHYNLQLVRVDRVCVYVCLCLFVEKCRSLY